MSAAPAAQETTVGELLQQITAATQRMSTKNPHRTLLVQCAVAITALAQRVPDEEQVTRSGIILPASGIVLP